MDGLRSSFWSQTPLKLKGVENPSSAVFLTLGKSQTDAEMSPTLLVFLQGAGDNSEVCEHLSKQRLETQHVDFSTLIV